MTPLILLCLEQSIHLYVYFLQPSILLLELLLGILLLNFRAKFVLQLSKVSKFNCQSDDPLPILDIDSSFE